MSNNGQSENQDKGPSKLALLVKEWERGGGKIPSKQDGAKLVKVLQMEKAGLEAAEKAVEAARAKVSEASVACIKAFGPANLEIGGATYTPTCRGESVYYKLLGAKKTLSFS